MSLAREKKQTSSNKYIICSGRWLDVARHSFPTLTILLFKNRFTIYDLRVPPTTLNFEITFYRKS
jgi:hypothetical protein